MWAIRMETYLEALNIWEALEEEYHDVPALPEDKKSKAKAILFLILILQRLCPQKQLKKYGISLNQNMKETKELQPLEIANRVRLLGADFNDSRQVEKIWLLC